MVGEESPFLTPEERKQLALAAKNGDGDSFLKLFLSYHNTLKAMVDRTLANCPGHLDSDDVLQSTFERAYEYLHEGKFDPTRSFYLYILRITKSVLYKEKKHCPDLPLTKNGRGHDGDSQEAEEYEVPDDDEDVIPDKMALYLDVIELLCECSAKPHQVIAILFMIFIQWRPQEIVKVLSSCSLRDLLEKFIADFTKIYRNILTKKMVCQRSMALCDKLRKKAILVYPEREYAHRMEGIADTAGELPICFFYGEDPAASLADWADKVQRRARIAAKTGILCDGSP